MAKNPYLVQREGRWVVEGGEGTPQGQQAALAQARREGLLRTMRRNQGAGGGGGGGGGLVLPPGLPPFAPPVGPPGVITPPPGGLGYLSLPESAVGFVPEQYRPQWGGAISGFLGGLGYTGRGVLGRYGETQYNPPAGAAEPYYLAPSLFAAMADPNLAPWVRYILGELGYTGRVGLPA